MADKNPKKDAYHVLVTERERTLASAVRRRASSIPFLERAFEEAGCSCSPFRQHLKELEAQYDAERSRLLHELDKSDLANNIKTLRKTITTTDLTEHPSLDTMARQAYPYLAVWMLDQTRDGKSEVLGLSDHEIASCYAEAWLQGWRPKSLYKPKRSRGNG